jgi:hypothetical protein
VTAVVDLLKATLDALSKLAPKAKLAESLTGLDPNLPSERALMQELMDLAFAETGSVDRIDFLEDMVYFVKSSDERDAGFLAAVAEGQVDLGEMKLEDVMLVRRQAADRGHVLRLWHAWGGTEVTQPRVAHRTREQTFGKSFVCRDACCAHSMYASS